MHAILEFLFLMETVVWQKNFIMPWKFAMFSEKKT